MSLNPVAPDIDKQILQTYLHIFPFLQNKVERIC